MGDVLDELFEGVAVVEGRLGGEGVFHAEHHGGLEVEVEQRQGDHAVQVQQEVVVETHLEVLAVRCSL